MAGQTAVPNTSKIFLNKLKNKIKKTKEENKENLKKLVEKTPESNKLGIDQIIDHSTTK